MVKRTDEWGAGMNSGLDGIEYCLAELVDAVEGNKWILAERVLMAVVQGVCSREDMLGISPSFLVDFAIQVADSMRVRQEERLNAGQPLI